MKGGCTERVLIIYLCAIALDNVYQNILSYLLGGGIHCVHQLMSPG